MLLCRVSYGWFIVCNEIENIYNKKRKGIYVLNSFLTPYGYGYGYGVVSSKLFLLLCIRYISNFNYIGSSIDNNKYIGVIF